VKFDIGTLEFDLIVRSLEKVTLIEKNKLRVIEK